MKIIFTTCSLFAISLIGVIADPPNQYVNIGGTGSSYTLPLNVLTNGGSAMIGPNILQNNANGNMLEVEPNINTLEAFQIDQLGSGIPIFTVDPEGVITGNGSSITNLNVTTATGTLPQSVLPGNVVTNTPVQQFERSNNIAAGTIADTDLQRMWGVFAANQRTANVTDIIPCGAQFNPTNYLTFMGRTWTHPPGLALPQLGDPNFAVFTNYGCGIEVDGLNLTSNYMVLVVFNLAPAAYQDQDAVTIGGGLGRGLSQIVMSLVNSNDNSGVFVTDDVDYHTKGAFALWPRGAGLNTNNVYDGGVGPGVNATSTNYWLRLNEYLYQGTSEVLNNYFILAGNTSATFRMHNDDLDGSFMDNSTPTANTNFWQVPFNKSGIGLATNSITTVRIGGDTNVCSFLNLYSPVFNRTNGSWRVQSVFIFNTNDTALMRMAYTASLYLGTQRKVYWHWGGSSLFDENEQGNDGANYAATTNSMSAKIQLQNPDWIIENTATGGETLLGMMTNQIGTNVPYDPIMDVPRPDFYEVVGGDGDRNLACNSPYYPPSVILTWWNQLFAPIASNGIPIWAWKTYMVGTNSANWNVPSSSNLLALNMSYDTNVLVSRVLDMARHVTNGSFTNSSSDSTHMLKNGLVYNECAMEFGGIAGAVQILWPDNYTAYSTGWTNWTAQTMVVSMTAATGLQIYDPYGNPRLASTATVTSLTSFTLAPLERFSGTLITATIKTASTQ